MRIAIYFAATALALCSSSSEACSIILPPPSEIVPKVAAKGVLFRGTLIQAFNAYKQQPEIFHADEIFVGDSGPRDFIIYRSDAEYANARKFLDARKMHRRIGSTCSEHMPIAFKAGQYLDRWTLIPAETITSDPAAKGLWTYSHEWEPIAQEQLVNSLSDQADALGRLKRRPPEREEPVVVK